VLERRDIDRVAGVLSVRRTISSGEVVELAKTRRSRRQVPLSERALAAGVSVFELARVMGTSVAMIERHYGTLIEGAGADIARRLSAFETAHHRAAEGV
jgi:hypothetical protein